MSPAKRPPKSRWSERADRSAVLAERYEGARELLAAYRQIVAYQEKVFENLVTDKDTDLGCLRLHFPALQRLAETLRLPLPDPEEVAGLIESAWHGNDIQEDVDLFFAEVLLQPYAEFLRGSADIEMKDGGCECPFCSALPVAAVLRPEGDGARRSLLCSRCSFEWNFRRILCPGCGEESKDKLPVFRSDHMPHVSVEACDTCKVYLKAIDLSKDGLAVPAVDEIAGITLDLWADQQGYRKLKTNLLGL